MNSIRNFLGRRKKNADQDSANKTLAQLKETERLLNKKCEFIESQIEEQIKVAKSHGLRNKIAAKRALKKRGMLQKTLEQATGMLSNVQSQLEALEGINVNKDVVDALSQGAVALKAANESIDLGKLNGLIDLIGEQQDIGQEIIYVINQPIGGQAQDIDEDDLNKELEALEQEELDKTLLIGIDSSEKKVLKKKTIDDIPSTSSGNGNINEGITNLYKISGNEKSKKEEENDEEEFTRLKVWSTSGI